jgi:hypothetical protein
LEIVGYTKMTKEELKNLIQNSIWNVGTITDEPSVTLLNWTIKDTAQGQFFVGDQVGAAGRVSTKVVEFDENTLTGRTESGRIYKLHGPSGYSSNGEYVWNYYAAANKLTPRE